MRQEYIEFIGQNSALIPRHVAIIMDGNGRWARSRGLPRTEGHRQGIEQVEVVTQAAQECGVKFLTIFAFSTENWTRPAGEVNMLMQSLEMYLKARLDSIIENNIRLGIIGRREKLSDKLLKIIDRSLAATKNNSGIFLNVALNYGSRAEIIDAVKNIYRELKENRLREEDVDEKKFSEFMYTKGLPDPDLLIRTSGEMRVSNFLLWQVSYSELYFTDTYWPDFGEDEFIKAIIDYVGRERRYGKVIGTDS